MKKYRFLSLLLAGLLALALTAPAAALEDPQPNCKAAIVVDGDNEEILYELNARQRMYPASITKIMTSLVVLDAVGAGEISLDTQVTASAQAVDLPWDSSTAGIKAGEILTVLDLLYCDLLPSGNEACNILSEAVAGTSAEFVARMNAKARELGMADTHFMNPHGLHDPEHYTTAYDIYLMASAAMDNETFRTIVRTPSYTLPATNLQPERTIYSSNGLLSSFYAIGYTYGKASEQKPVTAGDLNAQGAMAALLKDALKPNLVQTLEHVPAIVHGGPFANIAHGCNSVTATKMAMKLADYTITEAGFGADLGAEKFLDIKCRMAGLKPNAVVNVATVRALKYNGGVPKADLNNENLEALEKGLPNLLKHVSNIKDVYKLPCVVAINAFPTDTKAELDLVESKCKELGVNVALSEVWAKGGEGGVKLAEEVIRLVEEPNDFTFSYELEGTSIEDKLNAIVQKIYGGSRAVLTANAQKQAKELEALGFGSCPICVAKTQYSLTDDQTKLGAPKDFEVTVRNLKISAGAGFIVALTGEIMTMPGLPKVPAAERIDVDETGKISGLF